MAKNLTNLRFGIGRDDGYISNIWRLWVTKEGDAYLTTRSLGGVHKYSFHKSGISRSAFTSEHGIPPSMSDRAIFKWSRNETPAAGKMMAMSAALIAFPTDFLSRLPKEEGKPVEWIPSAPYGNATFVELAYTREEEEAVSSAFEKNGRRLVSYTKLPNGEGFFVNYYYGDWNNSDLHLPSSHGSKFGDLLFSADDPCCTGRPVRLVFGPKPKDGATLILQELGGYRKGITG